MNKDEFVDKKISEWRTGCCRLPALKAGRASYICPKCKRDVSLEFVLIVDFFSKQYDLTHESKDSNSNP